MSKANAMFSGMASIIAHRKQVPASDIAVLIYEYAKRPPRSGYVQVTFGEMFRTGKSSRL